MMVLGRHSSSRLPGLSTTDGRPGGSGRATQIARPSGRPAALGRAPACNDRYMSAARAGLERSGRRTTHTRTAATTRLAAPGAPRRGPAPPLSVAASTDAVVLVGNEHERDSTTSIRRDQDPCARNRLSQAKCRRTRTSMLGSRRTKIKEAALPRSARPRDESSGRLRGRGPAPRLDQTSGFSSRRGSNGRPRSSNLLLRRCSSAVRYSAPTTRFAACSHSAARWSELSAANRSATRTTSPPSVLRWSSTAAS
jgi:hypothetical protein